MQESSSTATSATVLNTLNLIRSEFPGVPLADLKALTETDRIELASAIARNRGLTHDQLSFTPVAY